MKRLVQSKDYTDIAPPVSDAWQVNRWGVCVAGYELRPVERGGSHSAWLRAKQPLRLTDVDGKNWRAYKPLEAYPDLFLRFARLSRKTSSPERALDWCNEYGVLGLAGDHHWGWTGENIRERYETLEDFDAQVERAAGVLAFYEAALNRDEEAAEHYVSDQYFAISAELYNAGLDRVQKPSLVQEMVEAHGGDYLAYALNAATSIVESTVREACYPTLRSEESRDPSEVKGSWGFKNLRAAMYLQMYWLMAAGGNVKRCKYCRGVMALSRSQPDTGKPGRKPRQDRKFCGDACRQRYHYHNTTKPRRTGKRP